MIIFYSDEKCFLLQTTQSSYCIRLTGNGNVMGAYWGAKIDDVRGVPDMQTYENCFSRMPSGISFGEYE